MIMGILYTLIIWPIEILFEFIFAIAKIILKGNIVLSILSLSLAVNILTLPLYKKADKLQNENKQKQTRMEPMIAHIKKTFIGDERFMMLQAYYRQSDYKPIHALRGSLSLFLQIPFFIAAYNFLSGMRVLNETSFGPINSLGRPDALLSFGGYVVNILPIAMTLINIISGAIYTKGQTVKTKIQLYGIALVFLILLYTSPSGLVLYWTFNNLFSLFKNIFDKIFAQSIKNRNIENKLDYHKNKKLDVVFWLGTSFLAVFTGCFIPSTIIKSSPTEFVDIWNAQNPCHYVLYSAMLAIGTFVIWIGLYYLLSDMKYKKIIGEIVFIICIVAIINYSYLGRKLSLINSNLQYDKYDVFNDSRLKIINLIVIIIIAVFIHFIYRLLKKHVIEVLFVLLISAIVLITVNLFSINAKYRKLINTGIQARDNEINIPLSRDGKNVIVFMLDRAMGTEFPYIINENPDLIEAFDGFTYYSNTVSFGGLTHFGSPSAFGGYEYTPWEMNERKSELLKDKHDEALSVLPVLFYQNGYNVTVCDPPYAGYIITPDLSIYDDYPGINAYITEGKFWGDADQRNDVIEKNRRRNFFCNSIMRISPMLFWVKIYNYGRYNQADASEMYSGVQVCDSVSTASGYKKDFLNWYYVLCNLNNISTVTDDETDTFLMMYNGSTHEPSLLQKPGYIPMETVDNRIYDNNLEFGYVLDGKTMEMSNTLQVSSYHVNMASLCRMADWFDWMRENGVYDNTRIIILADHGGPLSQFDLETADGTDLEQFMPLLMMKDFGATGFSVSEELMTNADGVSFAVKDIIDNPVNPFTGNSLERNEQNKDNIKIITSLFDFNDIDHMNIYPKGKWYTVDGDIHIVSNWEFLGEY